MRYDTAALSREYVSTVGYNPLEEPSTSTPREVAETLAELRHYHGKTQGLVVSFFDYTGHMARPWAEAGYLCLCFDKLHKPGEAETELFESGGAIIYRHADLAAENARTWGEIEWMVATLYEVTPGKLHVFGFPPCDHLATSGARHWASKREINPSFQSDAVRMAQRVERFAASFNAPCMVENPRSALSTLWRKPDFTFSPHEFGGYLPDDDVHPEWPEYIAPRDAYTKTTCLWTSGGFVAPEKRPVEPEILERVTRSGRTIRGSRQFMKLGGSSAKTKAIRSATPRGFAKAVFDANRGAS